MGKFGYRLVGTSRRYTLCNSFLVVYPAISNGHWQCQISTNFLSYTARYFQNTYITNPIKMLLCSNNTQTEKLLWIYIIKITHNIINALNNFRNKTLAEIFFWKYIRNLHPDNLNLKIKIKYKQHAKARKIQLGYGP